MITVEEATRLMQATATPVPVVAVPLTEAAGRVLREPLRADRDFPPFDRVTMDGIALRFEALRGGRRTFAVAGVQHAGAVPIPLGEGDGCLEVMTGTVLPPGTDTVIRYEDLSFTDRNGGRYAEVTAAPEAAGQNVHRQGSDRRAGDQLLAPGRLLSPPDVGVAASVGRSSLNVSRALTLAVVSTGDELVDVDQLPLPHQIRRSNAYALAAALGQAGARSQLYHLRDDPQQLETELRMILAGADGLVLSGGVSMGKADFVPAVLEALGVQKHFHTVAQKPGKPLWFGTSAEGKAVFALPGNPVSTMLCAIRYVLPWLRTGAQQTPEPPGRAVLTETISFAPPLTYFLPVQTFPGADGRRMGRPRPGGGSGDLANLTEADAFVELPAERKVFEAGEAFPIWKFRWSEF
ncbi:MAG: molybdopterin molybdotransferase MoeA [Ferruginibacter sp.]|nr:molybdopterin molybdotransferase MoeA [Cytophagales bacterium]